ncbi:MAG: glycosyltransferase [Aquabacterium sp.]|nr:glycosyltransferase [Ferruginibacter sp.]
MYKIVRIHNRLIVGGPALNVTLLSTYLSPQFETKLLVGKKDLHEKDAGYMAEQLGIVPIEITEMRRSIQPLNDIKAYFKIKKIIKEFKPDIVHTHASKSGAIGRLAASACNVQLIVHTFHGHVFHSYFSKPVSWLIVAFERWLAKKTHAIIAISDLQKRELVDVYKIAPANKIFTVPLGLNLEKFSEGQEGKRIIFREKYGFDSNELVIGIIGRIVPIKNHAMFIEVASLIKKKSGQNVRFAIIGDGDALPVIEKKCAALGLSYSYYVTTPKLKTDVVVTSWEKEIDQVLAGLDIVALTSYNEGTPVSLIEAQAAFKPVVSTSVGGVRDVITHGENGFITAVDDVRDFADYVMQLINDKGLRDKMGNTGYNTVIERYSKARLVKDVKKLYLDFLERVEVSERQVATV